MLPLSLLKAAIDHPMLIELKNGDTYNGRLVSCNVYMNICLKDVICTSKVRLSLAASAHIVNLVDMSRMESAFGSCRSVTFEATASSTLESQMILLIP